MLTFKDNDWVKAKDLKSGTVYVFKDGRVSIYLGRNTKNEYCFYNVCTCLFVRYDSYIFTLGNYDIQLKHIMQMIDEVLHTQMQQNVLVLRTMPSLFKTTLFEDKPRVKTWYTQNLIQRPNAPKLVDDDVNVSIYVGAKDLQAGHLYYTGSNPWRSTYLYLGRNSQKEFVWWFVCNDDYLQNKSVDYFVRESECTKTNKKVRPLETNIVIDTSDIELW